MIAAPCRPRRGSILVFVIIVIAALAGMTIVLARYAKVEAMISANRASSAQAMAVERGAEQYLLALIAQNADAVLGLGQTAGDLDQISVGSSGYFYVIRPDYLNDGDETKTYGLIDEASKLNVNMATSEMLMLLPNMQQQFADSIVDWRDPDDTPTGDGAEDSYYLGLAQPYHCKNAPFESVEELMLVRGADPQLLNGYGTVRGSIAPNTGGTNSNSLGGAPIGDASLALGLFQYLTVYSKEAAGAVPGQAGTPIGRINVNTAPAEVMMCIPGLTESDAQTLVNARPTYGEGSTDIAWVSNAIDPATATAITPFITGKASQYSADILAVSADGRSFKRVRVIIDTLQSTGTPVIVYRRDLTALGWPLDPSILTSLRNGEALGGTSSIGNGKTIR